MTLTAPGCGMGPVIAEDARQKIAALPTVERAKVHIVWDPQWTPQMISGNGAEGVGVGIGERGTPSDDLPRSVTDPVNGLRSAAG